MLRKLADHIASCREFAAKCESEAADAEDEDARQQRIEMAKHWRRLAQNYEYLESLERFLLDVQNKGRPFKIEDFPLPPDEHGAQ